MKDVDALLEGISARQGHFEFESGHHGDTWLELERLFLDPGAMRRVAEALAAPLAAHRPAVICGPLVEGTLLARPLELLA